MLDRQTYKDAFSELHASDGTLISRTAEASSVYHYHEENIVYPTPTPTATPAPSAEPTEPVDGTE